MQNFWKSSVRSSPDLPMQNYVFLFCLMRQNHYLSYFAFSMIGWMQNSSRSASASWDKIDTAFWHFQNVTRQCLFCHQRQKHCWSYFASRDNPIGWIGQMTRTILLDLRKVLVTWPKTLTNNQTQNINPKPKSEPKPKIKRTLKNLNLKPNP